MKKDKKIKYISFYITIFYYKLSDLSGPCFLGAPPPPYWLLAITISIFVIFFQIRWSLFTALEIIPHCVYGAVIFYHFADLLYFYWSYHIWQDLGVHYVWIERFLFKWNHSFLFWARSGDHLSCSWRYNHRFYNVLQQFSPVSFPGRSFGQFGYKVDVMDYRFHLRSINDIFAFRERKV